MGTAAWRWAGDPRPPLRAGAAGWWCWAPAQGHLAGSWHAATAGRRRSAPRLGRLPARPLPAPPPSDCSGGEDRSCLPHPVPGTHPAVTGGCCRVKIPPSNWGRSCWRSGAWAGEEQAALAHRGSGQAALVLGLCHAVPLVPAPTSLPYCPPRATAMLWGLAGEMRARNGPPAMGNTSTL